MAAINKLLTADGYTLYEVEKSNWQSPSVLTFDSRNSVSLTEDTIIDIILLGEGYLSTDISAFENYISDWYDTVFAIWPFSQFVSAFRVRAVFVASASRFDASGNGYFGLKEITDDLGRQTIDRDFGTDDFEKKLFDILYFVKDKDGLNMRTYSSDLTIGLSGDNPNEVSDISTAQDFDIYQIMLRNCMVAMSVFNSSGSNSISGFTTASTNAVIDPYREGKVTIAFAETRQHEFGHAFALFIDEYIDSREATAEQQEPSFKSVFELWNLTYTGVSEQVPWFHLSSAGKYQRSEDSFVSQQWMGGVREECVWHSEYKCLMNGGHHNYFYRTDESILDSSGNDVYADLRTTDRFCLWCEEIVTIKILEKTDTFLRFEDVLDSGGDINKLGRLWYDRWVNELRDEYWIKFDLETRIKDREVWYNTTSNISSNVPAQDLHSTNLMRKIVPRKPAGNLWFIVSDLDDE